MDRYFKDGYPVSNAGQPALKRKNQDGIVIDSTSMTVARVVATTVKNKDIALPKHIYTNKMGIMLH